MLTISSPEAARQDVLKVEPRLADSLVVSIFLLGVLLAAVVLLGGVVFISSIYLVVYAVVVTALPVAAFFISGYVLTFEGDRATLKGRLEDVMAASYEEMGALEIVCHPFGSYSFRILSWEKKVLISHLLAAAAGFSYFDKAGIEKIKSVLAVRAPRAEVTLKRHWSVRWHFIGLLTAAIIVPSAIANIYFMADPEISKRPLPLPVSFAASGKDETVTNWVRNTAFSLPSRYRAAGGKLMGDEYTDTISGAVFRVLVGPDMPFEPENRMIFFGETSTAAIEKSSLKWPVGVITLLARKRLVGGFKKFYTFRHGRNEGMIVADGWENNKVTLSRIWAGDGMIYMVRVESIGKEGDVFPLLYAVTSSVRQQRNPALQSDD